MTTIIYYYLLLRYHLIDTPINPSCFYIYFEANVVNPSIMFFPSFILLVVKDFFFSLHFHFFFTRLSFCITRKKIRTTHSSYLPFLSLFLLHSHIEDRH
ncbi:hypothetical protein BDA99DRAFT_502668 [Phascolomyces articulosus]|uniref:Uncharacterized protein n=1 Tax=Phascolomyces articulosus TaxID=60185 RepID=A0AAD5KHG3_9FUNG|nr:hypothetical protein BDA99DRAFT_502668 [Phascolomyces articulosus]